MNLHELVRPLVGIVNPFQPIVILVSVGFTVNAQYEQVPAWAPAVEVMAQPQPVADKTLQFLVQQRQNTIWHDFYLSGDWSALDRPAEQGGDPSKGPYAPPIVLEREALSKPPYAAPLKATGADPDREPPYAPPLLASASQGVPDEAVLWRVVVTSGGSKGNTYEILPQLATAAAQAVGKNMQADVFVDSDMRVTFGK